jgi:hypothetical protein
VVHNALVDEELAEHGRQTIYRLYGMVMHQFQLIEMNVWAIKALQFKPGVQLHQGFEKVRMWDAKGLFGQLVKDMATQEHWPPGMPEKLAEAAQVRNYLAHRFLREFFVAKESVENFDRGIYQLYAWLEMVTGLDEALETHVSSLNGGEIDPELAEELKQFIPESWPLDAPDATA